MIMHINSTNSEYLTHAVTIVDESAAASDLVFVQTYREEEFDYLVLLLLLGRNSYPIVRFLQFYIRYCAIFAIFPSIHYAYVIVSNQRCAAIWDARSVVHLYNW